MHKRVFKVIFITIIVCSISWQIQKLNPCTIILCHSVDGIWDQNAFGHCSCDSIGFREIEKKMMLNYVLGRIISVSHFHFIEMPFTRIVFSIRVAKSEK